MPKYEITSPDGKRFEITAPEGATQDEVLSYAQKQWQAPPEPSAPPPQPASMTDKIVGSAAGRTALGLAKPLIGAAQIGAHIGDAINEATGTKPVVSKWLDAKIQDLEDSKKRGMASYGHDPESMDWMGLAASLFPGAAIAKGVQGALPAATGAGTRALVSGAQGAAVGLAQPSAGKDFATEKTVQGGTGALLGGLASAGTDLVKGGAKIIGDVVRPLTEKGRARILDDYQQSLVPEGARAKVAKEIMSGKELVPGSKPTVGELVAGVPEATSLASHQAALERISHPVAIAPHFAARRGAQEGARLAPIEQIAGTADDMAAAIQRRADVTGPMRESALANANVAGKTIPGLEKVITRGEKGIEKSAKALSKLEPTATQVEPGALRSAVDIHGVPPKPLLSQKDVLMKKLLPEQIANRQGEVEAAREAIQHLKDSGLQPLRPDPILRSLKASVSQPGLRASDVVTKTLGALEDKLNAIKTKHGTVDAYDLYMVRKEMGNTIRKFAEETKTFDQKLTSGVLNKLQDAIDDSIEGAGGKGWKEYLKKYGEMSVDINRMTAGTELKTALRSPLETKERSTVFANAVNKNREDLAKTLTDKQMASVDAVMKDLARYDAYKNLAGKSSSGGGGAIPGNVEPSLPNILSRPAMVASWVMKKAGESAEEKIVKEATRRYLHDPQAVANALLHASPPSRRQQIIDAIMRQAPVVGGVAAGAAGR